MANSVPVLVQSVTGSPIIDSLIGRAAGAVGGALAAVMVPWLIKHGFDGLNIEVATTMFASLALLALSAGWAFLMNSRSQAAIVAHSVEAAITQAVPQAVVDAAKPGQIKEAAAAANLTARQPTGGIP